MFDLNQAETEYSSLTTEKLLLLIILSFCITSLIGGIFWPHSIVISSGTEITGGVVSWIVIVCVAVAELLHVSVTVKVLVTIIGQSLVEDITSL